MPGLGTGDARGVERSTAARQTVRRDFRAVKQKQRIFSVDGDFSVPYDPLMSVYFIQVGVDGPVKIGSAIDPKRRLCTLQTGHHNKLRLLRTIDGGIDVERGYQQMFDRQRISGEWFFFDPDMLTAEPPPIETATPNGKLKDSPPALAARRIITKFGGPATLARQLSIRNGETVPPSTVQSWQNAGIPVKWQHEVLYVAKLAGIGLAPEDFFEADPLSPGDAA
jgi:hypothetical protein